MILKNPIDRNWLNSIIYTRKKILNRCIHTATLSSLPPLPPLKQVSLTEFPGNLLCVTVAVTSEEFLPPPVVEIYSNLLQSIYFHFLYSWIWWMCLLLHSFVNDIVFKSTRCKPGSSNSNSLAQKFLALRLLPCGPVPFE